MTEQQIFDKVVELAHKALPKSKDRVFTMDSVVNTEGFESLDFIFLICKIEAEFGIKIPDRTWSKLHSMREVVLAIQTALDKKAKKK